MKQGEQHGASVQFPREGESVCDSRGNLLWSQGAQENE